MHCIHSPLRSQKLNKILIARLFQTGEYAGEVISEAYELEYGTDCLEVHVGAVEPGERAIVIDDLVATGGTLSAAIRLLGTGFLLDPLKLFHLHDFVYLDPVCSLHNSSHAGFQCFHRTIGS